jgi:predicted ATP-dependent endonuclease of OLD family
MIKLTAIELENFQTIGSRTVIPIRDLTLMFGPNGAGKSAVYDSLDLLRIIFSNDWGKDSSYLIGLLERWSNNSANPKTLGVGIQFELDSEWKIDHLAGYSSLSVFNRIKCASLNEDYLEDFRGQTFKIFVKFRRAYPHHKDWVFDEFQITNTAGKILQLEQAGDRYENKLRIFEKLWLDTIRHDDPFKKNIKFNSNGESYYELKFASLISEIKADKWFGDVSSQQIEDYLDNKDTVIALSESINETIEFFKLFANQSMNWDEENSGGLIFGSRTVPTPRELIFVVSGGPSQNRNTEIINNEEILRNVKGLINPNFSQWEVIAKSFSEDLCKEQLKTEDEYWQLTEHQKINSLLSEDLFLDNGYQISGDVRCLVNAEDLLNYETLDAINYSKIVSLNLIGPNGKKVEINDVGSGIGYVLPVLSSLAGKGISLIQQPELHLHPALQSALGSVIVKCVENKIHYNAFTLIETHSEHLLLRIMRLLKTSNSRAEEVIKPITFENVCILYFQPKGNGTTAIKRLRLGPDGQLIDRWPDGFFEERYKDIFDE